MSNALKIAKRVNMSEIESFDLNVKLNNIEGLLLFEAQLDISYKDIMDAETRFAYHLYMILHHKLYEYSILEAEEICLVENNHVVLSNKALYGYDKMTVVDTSTGKVLNSQNYSMRGELVYVGGIAEINVKYIYRQFPTQRHYLDYLDERHTHLGVSTMKRNFGAIKTALTLGMNTPAEIAEKGIGVLGDVFNGFHTDRKTGEIISLKEGQTKDNMTAIEYASYAVAELSSAKQAEVGQKEYAQRRDQVLKPGIPSVYIKTGADGQRQWFWEQYKDAHLQFRSGDVDVFPEESGAVAFYVQVDEEGSVPDEVVSFFYNKFR